MPRSAGGISASDWLPEVVVDFEEWLALRREAEEELIRNPPAPGAPPLAVWSADSTYAVFLKDRARAPNLAAVREVSMGLWNSGTGPDGRHGLGERTQAWPAPSRMLGTPDTWIWSWRRQGFSGLP